LYDAVIVRAGNDLSSLMAWTIRTSAPLTAALTAVPVAVAKSMLPPNIACTVMLALKRMIFASKPSAPKKPRSRATQKRKSNVLRETTAPRTGTGLLGFSADKVLLAPTAMKIDEIQKKQDDNSNSLRHRMIQRLSPLNGCRSFRYGKLTGRTQSNT
jgi:hypothetical protein